DRPQPARRLLRDRLLPARGAQADDDRDGAGVARIRAALFSVAASELAQRAVDAAESMVRGRGAARSARPRARRARELTRKGSPRRHEEELMARSAKMIAKRQDDNFVSFVVKSSSFNPRAR